jgi:hypothetical protein
MKCRLVCIALSSAALCVPALAADYPEERGSVPSAVPPSPDESGRVNNVPQWNVARTPATAADFFAHYDANRDGVVSWAEAQSDADLVRVFARADQNADGALTPGEFQNAAVLAHREAAGPRG